MWTRAHVTIDGGLGSRVILYGGDGGGAAAVWAGFSLPGRYVSIRIGDSPVFRSSHLMISLLQRNPPLAAAPLCLRSIFRGPPTAAFNTRGTVASCVAVATAARRSQSTTEAARPAVHFCDTFLWRQGSRRLGRYGVWGILASGIVGNVTIAGNAG